MTNSFKNLNINNRLLNALDDLGIKEPTPVQVEACPIIMSGKDVVGISQTGTGKTFAYLLPIIQSLTFSNQLQPRVLILVPTRELVVQVAEQIELLTSYITLRVNKVYGGTNIRTQHLALQQGTDILVATPGRLYDLMLANSVNMKSIVKLVIDEVDVMLDLGFRFQLTNIFELIRQKRQNIMFSATMTSDVERFINEFFIEPTKISIAVSGTPLENINQLAYEAPNFYSKVNLLKSLVTDKETYHKVLVFVSNKRDADRLFEALKEWFEEELCVIHSNKTQNYRLRSIRQFDEGLNRILVTTDVMARGIDLNKISHVVNFDTPNFPENYMHRIGRTGRAEQMGDAILFFTEREAPFKEAIETLMNMEITTLEFPEDVEVSEQLTPAERPKNEDLLNLNDKRTLHEPGPSFHEKKEKNKKTNQGGSYRRELAKKYKKPKTRGDKNYNRRKKK